MRGQPASRPPAAGILVLASITSVFSTLVNLLSSQHFPSTVALHIVFSKPSRRLWLNGASSVRVCCSSYGAFEACRIASRPARTIGVESWR